MNEARKHTDKRLIAAGAGNPPVVVDKERPISRAPRATSSSAPRSITTSSAPTRKEIIVVGCVADGSKAEMKKNKAVEMTREQADQLPAEAAHQGERRRPRFGQPRLRRTRRG